MALPPGRENLGEDAELDVNVRRILGVVGLGLGAAGLWILASEFNSRRFHLILEDERGLVTQGVYLPLGHRPFEPSEASLRGAYAPFDLPDTMALARGSRLFRDRVRLDQALYELYSAMAEHGVEPSGPHSGPRDLGLTERALTRISALPGLSLEQREAVRIFERTLHYHQALEELAELSTRLPTLASWLGEAEGLKGVDGAEALAERARSAQRVLVGKEPRVSASAASLPSPSVVEAPARFGPAMEMSGTATRSEGSENPVSRTATTTATSSRGAP